MRASPIPLPFLRQAFATRDGAASDDPAQASQVRPAFALSSPKLWRP